MVRRVLGLIKECALDDEEEQTFDVATHMSTLLQSASKSKPSVSQETGVIIFDSLPSAPVGTNKQIPEDKRVSAVILDAVSGIQEIMDELESTAELVADFAAQYIASTDKVLIQANSPLSHSFLAAAARASSAFTVFAISDTRKTLPESIQLSTTGKSASVTPDEEAEEVQPLAKLGVSVVILPETDVFSIMPQITKVLVVPDAVLPDGSVIASAGTSTVVLAASTFNVPVLSISGTYHFCPISLSSPPLFVGNSGFALGRPEDEDDDDDEDEDDCVVRVRAPLRGAYYDREIVREGIDLFISNV
jgi:translation initiation factor 2B subunit (eIF-2B alpha/beta/delta family)